MVRAGIASLLDGDFEVEEACDASEAREAVAALAGFEVAVVELARPSANGPGQEPGRQTIRELRRSHPGLGIVAMGERADRLIAADAVRAGADAFVSREAPTAEIVDAVSSAQQRERFVEPKAGGGRRKPRGLTRRQRQILQLIADGQSTAQTAEELGLAEDTVRTHTKQLIARIGARNRAHAVALALRGALID